MDDTEQHINNIFPDDQMQRYAVCFSDGQKVEVIAESEEMARSDALSGYYENDVYCTRVINLKFEEYKVKRSTRSDKLRNLLFPANK